MSTFPANESNFQIWIPELFGFKGGIQTYSAFLLQALQSLQPQANYQVFLKRDRAPLPQHPYLPNTQFYNSGHLPLKLQTAGFATQLLIQGLFHKPDLIITTHANFSPVANWLKQIAGIPYWVIAHGVDVWDIQRPAFKNALQNCDQILAVSNYTRDRLLREQNLPAEKVGILPNTFDAKQFNLAPKPNYLLKRYNLDSSQKIILTVARLSATEQYKGYDKVIQALPRVIQAVPNAHYLLVGKGDDAPRIEELISSLNLENHVTLTGFVTDEELCDHYNLCEVFAMPSKGEGFGIVFLEAMACGKPVLGGNQDATVDALCQGKLGALVNPDQVEEIANTLVAILKGNHSNSLLYQPQTLRQKVVETFGFSPFQQTLSHYLEQSSINY